MARKPKRDLSTVSLAELQQLTGRTYKTIKARLVAAGVEPKRAEGTALYYAAPESLAAVYGEAGEHVTAGDELALLNRARRELAELELAERRNELAPIADTERVVVELLSGVRTQLLAVGPAVAQEVASTDSAAEANEIISGAVTHALAGIADATIATRPARKSG